MKAKFAGHWRRLATMRLTLESSTLEHLCWLSREPCLFCNIYFREGGCA